MGKYTDGGINANLTTSLLKHSVFHDESSCLDFIVLHIKVATSLIGLNQLEKSFFLPFNPHLLKFNELFILDGTSLENILMEVSKLA